MPISFPASPTIGQQSTQNGRTYAWSGSAWEFAPEGVLNLGDTGNVSVFTLAIGNATFARVRNTTLQFLPVSATYGVNFTMPTPVAGKQFTLIYGSDSTPTVNKMAAFTNVRWTSGNAPTVTQNTFSYQAYDVFTFKSDGTYWFGDVNQDYRSDTSSTAKPAFDQNYQTGTWTPAYTGDITQPSLIYTSETVGTWTRIGQLVFACGRIGINGRTGGSGNLRVVGLPFTIAGGVPNYAAVNIGWRGGWVTNAPNTGYLEPSTKGFVLMNFPAAAGAQSVVQVANIATPTVTIPGGNIIFSLTYHKS